MAAQPEYSRQQTGSLRRVADREDPFTSRRRSLWATLLGAAALFSAGAGAIHAATVSYQFGESTLYGITFVTFAVGVVNVPDPSAAFTVIDGEARTVGAPLGPAAGAALPATFPGSVATTLEGLAVAGGVAALALSARDRAAGAARRAGVWIGAAIVAIPLATMAVLTQLGVITAFPAAT